MNPSMLHQTDECQHCSKAVHGGEDTTIENVVNKNSSFVKLQNRAQRVTGHVPKTSIKAKEA